MGLNTAGVYMVVPTVCYYGFNDFSKTVNYIGEVCFVEECVN